MAPGKWEVQLRECCKRRHEWRSVAGQRSFEEKYTNWVINAQRRSRLGGDNPQ